MGKMAFLYPGQGSQKVGMGSDIWRSNPEVFKRYFSLCDMLAEKPVTRLCLEGPLADLSQSHIAQPALFTHSLLLTEYARQLGLFPNFVAGHSLGEYTAAVAANMLSFEEGLYLVCQRGNFMHQAQSERPGAMAAIIGLDFNILETLCSEIGQQSLLVIANWNAPTQFVVSGEEAGIQRLISVVRSQNGKALRLSVDGAFHSPLMQPTQIALQKILYSLSWSDPTIPLVANASGQILTNAQQICQALIEQITGPIRWVLCVQALVQAGCDTFLELGPSRVLTRLIQAIAPNVHAFAACTLEDLRAFVASRKVAEN